MVDKVLTANRLTDGVAVWLNANGEWATSLQEALVARHAEAEASLEAIGKQAYADNKVVDVNLIDVRETDGKLWPLRLRERIRAEGPTMEYAPVTPPPIPNSLQSEKSRGNHVSLRRIRPCLCRGTCRTVPRSGGATPLG